MGRPLLLFLLLLFFLLLRLKSEAWGLKPAVLKLPPAHSVSETVPPSP
jgi:hypothetical protein